MTDDELRRLERKAREGEPGAEAAFERARARSGAQVCDYRHEGRSRRACSHVLEAGPGPAVRFKRRFSGRGGDYDLVCEGCTGERDLVETCAACFSRIELEGDFAGFLGEPRILERPGSVRFEHRDVDLSFAGPTFDVRPIPGRAEPHWLALGEDRRLRVLDLAAHQVLSTSEPVPGVLPGFDWRLHASPDGELAALVHERGQKGLVVEVGTGRATMTLDRGDYHPEQTRFPVAFARRGEHLVLIHGTDWNRLDVSDPWTGRLVTARPSPDVRSQEHPEHDLDYFHGGLVVSPSGERIAEHGWVWQPVGVVRSWSLARWLDENPWEADDGPSVRDRYGLRDYWDGPLAWLDERTLVIPDLGEWNDVKAGAVLYDADTCRLVRWFPGPSGAFFVVGPWLVSAGNGTSVWDVATGERLVHEPGLSPHDWHPGARHFLSLERNQAFGPKGRLGTLHPTA